MTSKHRITSCFIADVVDALAGHGYVLCDDLHAERAHRPHRRPSPHLEGTRDHPAAAYPITTPLSPLACPGPSRHDAAVTRTDASTMFAALNIAAAKRCRIEMCPDCPGQSCSACQTHLHDARAFDQTADRILQAAPAVSASRTGPDRRPQPAGRQVGQ
jgi:hypothetical protein